MSRASPEVAPYPFTTLHPLIGCIEYRDGLRIRAADIPGLIAGASEGRGRGHDFLKHIERTKALLYIVDAAGVDFRNPVEDLRVLVDELSCYGDGSLLERRALVVANKVDLLTKERIAEILARVGEAADEIGIQTDHDVLGISAGVTGDGLGELSKAIRDVVTQTEMDRKLAFDHADQFVS
jgi:GTPase